MPLVAYLWIAFLLNYVDRQMVYSIFPALEGDLGFTSSTLGLIGSVFMWVYTLSMPLAGRLADRGRAGRLMVISLVLWSAATWGCATATSQTVFLWWRAVIGLTEALYFPAALTVLAAAYPPEARSRALGFHQSAMNIGIILGGWYGGWTADNIGWRDGFAIAGGIGIAYSVVLWWRVRDIESPVKEPVSALGSLRLLVRNGPFLALSGVFCLFNAVQWVLLAWFPTFLQDRFQLSMTDSGFNATVYVQVCVVLGIFLGSVLTDQLRKRYAFARLYVSAIGLLCSAPFTWLAFQSQDIGEARLYSALFGLLAGFLTGNVFAAVYDITPIETRGLSGALLNMTGGVSAAIMIYMAGLWRDTIGIAALLGWLTVVATAAAVTLLAVAYRSR